MAKISLIMFYNWMAATIGYYGLSFLSVHLSGDIYINCILSALIEIPSYLFCLLVSFYVFNTDSDLVIILISPMSDLRHLCRYEYAYTTYIIRIKLGFYKLDSNIFNYGL